MIVKISRDKLKSMILESVGRILRESEGDMDSMYFDAYKRGDEKTAYELVRNAAAAAMPETKVLDSDGKPIMMTHCTDNEGFYKFDRSKIGTGQGQAFLGAGFNFSRGYGSSVYGKRGISAFLNAKNPLRNDKLTLSGYSIKRAIMALDTMSSERVEDSWGDMQSAVKSLLQTGSDLDVYAAITMVYFGDYSDVLEVFEKMGYDSTIEYDDSGNIMNAVVFSSSQIKSAEPFTFGDDGKLIPLSERFDLNNEDIRYEE